MRESGSIIGLVIVVTFIEFALSAQPDCFRTSNPGVSLDWRVLCEVEINAFAVVTPSTFAVVDTVWVVGYVPHFPPIVGFAGIINQVIQDKHQPYHYRHCRRNL